MRSLLVGLSTLLVMLVGTLRAQIIETPVPFDSAGRVVAVTPAVAERLKLLAPAWPVTGAYREVRLYSINPAGGFVLVAQLESGALQRYPLSALERETLSGAIDLAMRASGRPSAEAMADLVSEPAGNAFARHQTFLAATVYGPVAASLFDDGRSAGAAYLLTTGLAFFISYGAGQDTPFTRAQSDLAGNLGLATGVGGWLVGYASTGRAERGVRGAALGSAVVGTVAGASLGKRLSDAEVHAATLGIETQAVAGAMISAGVGADPRTTALVATVTGGLGFPVGLRYPRHASYKVTAGDVEAASTAGLIGMLVGGSILSTMDNPKWRPNLLVLGGSYLAGTAVGDLAIARRFDLTQSQANMLKVSAAAGGLIGLAIPVLSDANSTAADFAFAAGGATLGMAAMASTYRVRRVGMQLDFLPSGLTAATARVPGAHSLVRIRF